MKKKISNLVWENNKENTHQIGLPHIGVLIALIIIGIIIGTYGSISAPLGIKKSLHVSGFWPGQLIQGVGCIWFGAWGALAAFLFPLISNILGGQADAIVSIAFLPANLIQGILVGWGFRHFQADPCLRDGRSWGIWILFGGIISNILGAAWGTTVLVYSNTIPQASQLTAFIGWTVGNALPTLTIGSIVMWFGSPLIIKTKVFCRGYWV